MSVKSKAFQKHINFNVDASLNYRKDYVYVNFLRTKKDFHSFLVISNINYPIYKIFVLTLNKLIRAFRTKKTEVAEKCKKLNKKPVVFL